MSFFVSMNALTLDEVIFDLENVGAAGDEAAIRASNFVAQSTAQRARISMRNESKTGRVYEHEVYGLHQASAPGEAPAVLSGELVRSIFWRRMTATTDTAIAGTNDPKGKDLEFGFTNTQGYWVEPRPWLYPAYRAAVTQAAKVLKREFLKRVRKR